jgi:hypothetical protein
MLKHFNLNFVFGIVKLRRGAGLEIQRVGGSPRR